MSKETKVHAAMAALLLMLPLVVGAQERVKSPEKKTQATGLLLPAVQKVAEPPPADPAQAGDEHEFEWDVLAGKATAADRAVQEVAEPPPPDPALVHGEHEVEYDLNAGAPKAADRAVQPVEPVPQQGIEPDEIDARARDTEARPSPPAPALDKASPRSAPRPAGGDKPVSKGE